MTTFSLGASRTDFRRFMPQAAGVALLAFAGMAIAFVSANVAVSRGWYLVFGALGILFLMVISARYVPLGLLAILVAFTANYSLVDLSEGRWLILAAVVAPFAFTAVTRYRHGIVLTRMHVAFLAFFALIFLSVIYSESAILTFAKGISVFLMFACFFMVLYYHLKFQPSDFHAVFNVLLYFNAVVMLWVFVNRPMEILTFSLTHSELGNPNSLGAFVALTLPFVIFQYYHAKGNMGRLFWIGLLIINLAALFASESRAGIVGALTGLSLYWIARSRVGFYYFGGWLALGLCAAVVLSPTARTNIVDRYIYKRQGNVLTSREPLWERTWETFKRKPLTGVGFGVSEGQGEKWRFQFSSGGALLESGSSLMFLLEGLGIFGGILGFLPVFLLLGHAAPRYMRVVRAREPTEEDQRFCVLVAAVTGGFVNCQFEGWLYAAGSMWAMVFWCTAALLLYVLTEMEERELGLLPMPDDAPVPTAMLPARLGSQEP